MEVMSEIMPIKMIIGLLIETGKVVGRDNGTIKLVQETGKHGK